jgi:hypothetical protein
MIFAECRDAGTRPLVILGKVPGEDQVTWIEVDYEDDLIHSDVLFATNAAMTAVEPYLTIAPWPLPIPRQAPVDLTQRYIGLQFQLYQYDVIRDDWSPVPGGLAVIQQDGDPLADPFDRDQQNLSRQLNVSEIQGRAQDPTGWVRLPFVNETGGTELKEPLWVRWQSLQNSRFTIALPDNNYFEPFDLTHMDRYQVVDENWRPIDSGAFFAQFADRARLVFYLRPRRMRWIVTVIAHYDLSNWFEDADNDETFITAYYQRPPFFPYRSDFPTSTDPSSYDLFDFFGNPCSYDQGLYSSWDLSQHSQDLRQQIIDEQWWSECEAYIFTGNEDPVLDLEAYPPRPYEIVAGIGFVDEATGREQRVWIQQVANLYAVYPQRNIGTFLMSGWEV